MAAFLFAENSSRAMFFHIPGRQHILLQNSTNLSIHLPLLLKGIFFHYNIYTGD
jgi:hypothetical protein